MMKLMIVRASIILFVIGLTTCFVTLGKLTDAQDKLVVLQGPLRAVPEKAYKLERNVLAQGQNMIERAAPDLQNLILYPGAQYVKVDGSNLQNWTVTTFSTPELERNVFSFYKDTLPKQGWTLVSETSYSGSLTFLWTDTQDGVPWNIDLYITTGASTNEETYVYLNATRWPDVKRIPLYPGAQNIFVNHVEASDGFKESITKTYTVNVGPQEVEAYYKTNLVLHGWMLREVSGPSDSQKSMHFVFVREWGEILVGGELYIEVNQISRSETQVEMKAKASNFPQKTVTDDAESSQDKDR